MFRCRRCHRGPPNPRLKQTEKKYVSRKPTVIVTLCSLLSCINTSSNHSSVDLDDNHGRFGCRSREPFDMGCEKHRQGPGLGVARWRRADPSCTCTQRKRSDRHTHAWHDDGERWLVGVAERLCSLPTNMAIQPEERKILHCIRRGHGMACAALAIAKRLSFCLGRPAVPAHPVAPDACDRGGR